MEFHKIHMIGNGQFHVYQFYMNNEPVSIILNDDITFQNLTPPESFEIINSSTNLKCKGINITITSDTFITIGTQKVNLKVNYSNVYLISNFIQHKKFILPPMSDSDCIIFAGDNMNPYKDSYDNNDVLIGGITSESTSDEVHSCMLRKYNALFNNINIKFKPLMLSPGIADFDTSDIIKSYINCMQLRWDMIQTGLVIRNAYFVIVNPVLYPNIKPNVDISDYDQVYILAPSKLFIQNSQDIMSALESCKKYLKIKMIDNIPDVDNSIVNSVKQLIRSTLESSKQLITITYDGRLGTCFRFKNINNVTYDHVNAGPQGCKVVYNKMMNQMLPQTIKTFSFLPEYVLDDKFVAFNRKNDEKNIMFERNILYISVESKKYKFIDLNDFSK